MTVDRHMGIPEQIALLGSMAEESANEFRVRATKGVALSALLFLTPFALNDFWHGRLLLGTGSLAVVAILSLIAWQLQRGHYNPMLVFCALVPCVLLILAIAFHWQGVIGVLWCFPAVVAFYFMMPPPLALWANLLLLVVAIPHAAYLLDLQIAARVVATLLVTSIFALIFVQGITRQHQQLMRSEAQRREGMASASHELRTPLATLNAQVEAMLDGIRPLNRDQLISASRSLGHINGLVDDLYLLALADVGALVCRRERLHWDTLVEVSLKAAQHKLMQQGITLEGVIDRPVTLTGDPQRLRQILDNLLENCRGHAGSGASVRVELHLHQGRAELTVSDNGHGMSDEELTSLFERFYRAEGSRSRESGGSGLGLALVKALAEAHGGRAYAFHSKGGGLTVRVVLPAGE